LTQEMQDLIDALKEAQGQILGRSRALRLLVEGSEAARRQKARALLESGAVKWVRADEPDSITALVQGTQAYPVSITLKGGGRAIVKCDCYDHGRAGTCKHVLAVVGACVLGYSRDWKKLKTAVAALEGR
jgi:uncharacterized Zn finger protein